MKKIIGKLMLFIFMFSITLFNISNVHADETITKSRIFGNDRIETSVKISESGWENGTDTAVIAQAYGYADALCAAPLAKKYNAPILLTDKSALSDETINELKRLKVKKVFIIGGTGSLSENLENQLSNIGIRNSERLWGKDRYETSLKVAESLGEVDNIVITSGNGYADSLSIAPIAAQKGMPILLTEKDSLTDEIKAYIKSRNINTSYIIGGTGVISDKIQSELPNGTRLSGQDRFETNLAIIQNFQNELNFDNVFIAEGDGITGTEFADSLSASALAAQKSSPVILIYKTMPSKTAGFLKSKMSEKTNLTAIGGSAVVANEILDAVIDIFNGKTPTAGVGDPAVATSSGSSTGDNTFTMTITKNNQSSTIKKFTMAIDKDKTNENAMEYLKSVTEVTELQGKGFINGIDGLLYVPLEDMSTSDREDGYYGIDWFIYLNGDLTDTGAEGVYPEAGDTLNFDYHKWDWHALVAPGTSTMPLTLEDVPSSVSRGDSIKLRVTCIYRGVYDAVVKVDGNQVATTDIDGYATITINSSETHKVTVEKNGGSASKTVTVSSSSGGGSSSGGSGSSGESDDDDTKLINITGDVTLSIIETEDNTIKIQASSESDTDYITLTLYDEQGNLKYINQTTGNMAESTELDLGKYHGSIKASSASMINIDEFEVK